MVAQEAVPILMQIVDQIPIEAVLSDDVNGACGVQNQLGDEHEHEEQRSHELTVSTVVKDTAQEQGASLSRTQSTTPFNRLTFAGMSGGTSWGIKKPGQSSQW